MKRSTPEHPKLLDLCARLHLRRWEAVGILESLWHFTAKFAPQGDIGRFTNTAIAKGIDWNRAPERLITALVESRWLDECDCHRLMIHDWSDHADQTLKRLLASRGLAFIQHDASSKKPARLTCLAPASPPLPLPLPEPEPNQTGEADMRINSQPEWKTDQTFQPFVEAYRKTGAALIDEDFALAHFSWRLMDFEQKAKALNGITERIEKGVWSDPAMIHNPKNYLKGEYKRDVLARSRSGPVDPIVEAKRLARERAERNQPHA